MVRVLSVIECFRRFMFVNKVVLRYLRFNGVWFMICCKVYCIVACRSWIMQAN